MLGLTDHVICSSKDLVTIVQWLAKEDAELAKGLAKEDAERRKEWKEKRCKEWKEKEWNVEKLDTAGRSKPSFYAIYKDQLLIDVGNAYALLDAGVSDVTVMIDKSPEQDDPDKGLDWPTRGFGGCVLISRRRVAMPEGLPEEWTNAGGRCTLLRGRDGPDRGAYQRISAPR